MCDSPEQYWQSGKVRILEVALLLQYNIISLTQGGRSVALVALALTQQPHRASTLTPLHVLAGLDSMVDCKNF